MGVLGHFHSFLLIVYLVGAKHFQFIIAKYMYMHAMGIINNRGGELSATRGFLSYYLVSFHPTSDLDRTMPTARTDRERKRYFGAAFARVADFLSARRYVVKV